MDAFLELFTGLPRQGPGSDASTRRALSLVPKLPEKPRILDLGCGTGRASLVLAEETGGHVVSVDLYQPFLDELAQGASERNLSIETRLESMDALTDPDSTYDLIWSEGAAYLIGLEPALALWKPLLKKGCHIALSEATWLTNTRPIQAMQFWADAYPDMEDERANLKTFRRQGFEPVAQFVLPAEDWTAEYYDVLERRMQERTDLADTDAVAATRREIDMFRRFGDSYGYVFYIARKL